MPAGPPRVVLYVRVSTNDQTTALQRDEATRLIATRIFVLDRSVPNGHDWFVAMGRPREFDEDEVLDRALEVFWSRGYEATSVTDLMQATGLAKGSVYKGFGDKKSLFLRTLDRYLSRGLAVYAALDDGVRDAVAVLRDWLTQGVERATESGVRKGCFSVNCTVELAPHDPELRKQLRANERRLEAMFERTIARGIADGSMRSDLDPKVAARFVTTTLAGFQVAAKTGMSQAEALAMVEMALSGLARRAHAKH